MIKDTSAQDLVLVAKPWYTRPFLRWLIGGSLIATLSIGYMIQSWSSSLHSVSRQNIQLAVVQQGDLVRDLLVNGKIVASNSPSLFSQAAGVVKLHVKAGDSIKKGQLLAEIDSKEVLEAYQREHATTLQMEADLARQKIIARKLELAAQRDADQAEIEHNAAQLTLQRYDSVGGAGAVSRNEYLRAKDAVRSSQIRATHTKKAAALEAEDVALELQSKSAQVQRQKLILEGAKQRVEALKIFAPMDGMVGSIAIPDKTAIAANSPVVTVVDLSHMEVEVEIPENYLSEMGLGMVVDVSVNDKTHTGKLISISPEVVKNQVLGRVRLSDDQVSGLRQNQRVTARVFIEKKERVLLVARGSFLDTLGGKNAYFLDGNQVVRRPIEVGATSVQAVEIKSGAKAGDTLVIQGNDLFKNEARITLSN